MSQKRQLVVFFVAVFAWTWGLAALFVMAPDWVETSFGPISATQPLFILAVYAPSLLSLVLTAVFEGGAGLRNLLARLNPLRAPLWWFVVIPVAFVIIALVPGLVAWVIGRGEAPAFAGWAFVGSALTVMFLAEPGPLGEELGWRGFALPRMHTIWSPRKASLILGVIWAVWHLPAFFISGSPQQALALPFFIAGAISISVMASWLFVNTAGSVLLSMLLHRMANGANDITGVTFETYAVGTMVVAALLLAFGGLQKPAPAAAKHEAPDG
jgi:membrane protease YdiL (CAAX protease family)